jgi:hypothetical protein
VWCVRPRRLRPLRAVVGDPGQAPRVTGPWVRPWLLGSLYNLYFDAAMCGLAIKTIMNGAGREYDGDAIINLSSLPRIVSNMHML